MDGGPSGLPAHGGWQHSIWSAQQTQRDALSVLDADSHRLPPALSRRVRERLETMADALASAFEPPRFTHGDCHASQFFLVQSDGGWQVSGVVDMEVASAGDCVVDVLKFGLELAVTSPRLRWWEPFFAGYGSTPDFELVRLRLLGWHAANFAAYGRPIPPRAVVLERQLAARDWAGVFGV